MAKFRCNETGNIIEFFSDYDLKAMRINTEYTEVVEDKEDKEVKKKVVEEKKP